MNIQSQHFLFFLFLIYLNLVFLHSFIITYIESSICLSWPSLGEKVTHEFEQTLMGRWGADQETYGS